MKHFLLVSVRVQRFINMLVAFRLVYSTSVRQDCFISPSMKSVSYVDHLEHFAFSD